MLEKEIIAWFKKNQRDLPWRKSDAWGVMVSEFMLQQPPVNRVLPIYESWMNRWPTAAALAKLLVANTFDAESKEDLLMNLHYKRHQLN